MSKEELLYNLVEEFHNLHGIKDGLHIYDTTDEHAFHLDNSYRCDYKTKYTFECSREYDMDEDTFDYKFMDCSSFESSLEKCSIENMIEIIKEYLNDGK